MNKIFYIGDIECSSLNNELRFECFQDLFYKYLDQSKYSLTYSGYDNNLNTIYDYDTIVLGGNNILSNEYINKIYSLISTKKNIIIWGSGCNFPSKEFIDILENTNDPPYLYSYSSEEKLQELATYCKFFSVSGPLTYKVLSKSFVDTSNILISGDPGFLLREKTLLKTYPILKFSDKDKIIAINWGSSCNSFYEESELQVEDILSKSCNIFINRGYKIYIYPLCKDDISPCQCLYKKINDTNNVILDTNLYSNAEILSILKKCYISINLKSDSNIISSVANIPFISLGYNLKSIDFIKAINSEDLLLFTNKVYSTQNLVDKLNYINNHYNSIIDIIRNQIESYNFILEMPFKNNLF